MNYRFVISRLGLLFMVLSTIMLAITAGFFLFEALLDHPTDPAARQAFLLSGGVGLILSMLTWLLTRRGSRHLGRREAMLLVAISWLLGAAFAAMPYWIWSHTHFDPGEWHIFKNYVDCYFEAMSGLTTTGATVLGDAESLIEELPRSLLLWRATTHWLGGLGIVVLFVAVLPSLGVGAKRLFRVEAPGPTPEGVRPQIRESARMLVYIYLGLTVAEVIALMVAGLGLFDAVCHTFATLATGGFSTRGASVGAFYDTPAVDGIVMIFMVLAGMNFGLYYLLIRGRVKEVLRDTELRVYLILLAAGTALVWLAVGSSEAPIMLTDGQPVANTVGESLRQSAFTTLSIQTTTGFCTSDFNRWPFLAQAVLVLLMFVGGCAGSTGGGVKVIRLWIAVKTMLAELEHVFRPNVVRPVKIGRSVIDDDLKLGTVAYVLGAVLLFAIGAGAVMLLEQANPASDCDFTSAATASVATLFTIGPGLSRIGAVENYAWFCWESKLVLSLWMALGRLEIFAIVVLFSPRFWRRD